jgi:hypothetical protein
VTALALAPGGERCALLGAGNCNDVDLEALTARYREVQLVDLDHEAVAGARARQPAAVAARVSLISPVDLCGVLHRLPAIGKRTLAPPELGALPGAGAEAVLTALPQRFDVAVSTCVLSQVVHTCERALGRAHAQLEAVACALVVAHVRALAQLVRPGGTGILVTDMVSSETYPSRSCGASGRRRPWPTSWRRAGITSRAPAPRSSGRILLTDPVIAPLVEPPRLIEPWRWRFNPDLTFWPTPWSSAAAPPDARKRRHSGLRPPALLDEKRWLHEHLGGDYNRALSLAGLRPAVPGHDDQLHRPADPGAAQAHPRRPAQVDQRAVRQRQLVLPGRVRHRLLLLRQVRRSLRHQDRLHGLHRRLELRRRGATRWSRP